MSQPIFWKPGIDSTFYRTFHDEADQNVTQFIDLKKLCSFDTPSLKMRFIEISFYSGCKWDVVITPPKNLLDNLRKAQTDSLEKSKPALALIENLQQQILAQLKNPSTSQQNNDPHFDEKSPVSSDDGLDSDGEPPPPQLDAGLNKSFPGLK